MSMDDVLRTIGHLTCLTSIGVFVTAMNLAAANAVAMRSPPSCTQQGCALYTRAQPRTVISQARIESIARAL